MQHFWLFVLFFLAAVPLTDFATTIIPWYDMKIKHTWQSVPVNWENLGHPSAGSTIDLHIVLEPDQENALTDAVSEISNPEHPRYRAFLSKEQLYELVRPSQDSVELVCAWLAHNGIRSSSISRTHGGTWLTVTDVRIPQASQLLGASYKLYRNTKTNETIIRTVGYSLPRILHTHVQTMMPTTSFSSMKVMVQTPHRRSFGPEPAQMQAGSGKLGMVRARYYPPEDLRWLYGTVQYQPAAFGPGQNSLAVVADRLPRQQDLTLFMDAYQKQNAAGATFNVQNVDGNPLNLEENPNRVVSGMVQYATAMAYPTPLSVFRIERTEDAFLELLHFLRDMQNIPRTIAISMNYFQEDGLSEDSANTMCHLFEQLGGRGASVLVASGDDGVGAGHCYAFVIGFPSSCPWVTSVGGTQLKNPYSEIAWRHSGGGFSRYFERPPYQANAVPRFLQDAGYPYGPSRYNAEGRGYPDISAQAFDCRIFWNGGATSLFGTSCSVSIAAGIVSLLNDYMISTRPAGVLPDKAPLGFLNPWLYSDEVRRIGALNDIVVGLNPGCGTPGFTSRAGWDPVTGLGTLNFPKLQTLLIHKRFLALTPTPVPTPS